MRYSQRKSLRSLIPRVTVWDLAWECCKGLRHVFTVDSGLYEFYSILPELLFEIPRQDQTSMTPQRCGTGPLPFAQHATSNSGGDSSLTVNALSFG
jgi:hypothetical protein